MRVLQVIHGFPPYYMAGSEVYAYNLSKELNNELDVYIFTRVENSFLRNFELFSEEFDNLKTYRVNNITPEYSLERKYLNRNIDIIFRKVLEEIKPDIVHIQHLSHLSTNIVNIVKEYNLPIVFTIHDFWMFCVRGQLLTRDLQICNGPNFSECVNCLSYLNTQEGNFYAYSLHMKNILSKIDIFLSPSKTLRNFYIENGIPEEKVLFSPYGFDKSRITFKKKRFEKNSKINFGFVGRIIPAKGVHLLIEAFNKINNENIHLYIFGSLGKDGIYLKKLAKNKNIHFEGGFDNRDIDKILDKIDVLVVPSIWYENSPLVIQEAFLKGIPVITSNIGGMAELVKDGVNGFLFDVGNVDALVKVIKKIADNPEILNNLRVNPDDVRDIKDDANFIKQLYKRLVK